MCLTMGFRVSLQLKKRRLAWAVVLQVPPVCPTGTPALGTYQEHRDPTEPNVDRDVLMYLVARAA